jgi:hypothetical protein
VRAGAPYPDERETKRKIFNEFLAFQAKTLACWPASVEAAAAKDCLARLMFLGLSHPGEFRGERIGLAPRAYVHTMNALCGVRHPFDDGTDATCAWAKQEGWLI